jgi:hypothetical protein
MLLLLAPGVGMGVGEIDAEDARIPGLPLVGVGQ